MSWDCLLWLATGWLGAAGIGAAAIRKPGFVALATGRTGLHLVAASIRNFAVVDLTGLAATFAGVAATALGLTLIGVLVLALMRIS